MEKAGPRQVKAPKRVKMAGERKVGRKLHPPKEQDAFEGQAIELAAALGWEGEPKWEIFDLRVQDAQVYLRKVLHEIHVHVMAPERIALPTVDAVAGHMGIPVDDEERLAILRTALDTALETELAFKAEIDAGS